MTSTLIRPFRRFCGLFIILVLLGAASAQAAVPASQRQYLLSLYAATDGPNWSNNTNWGGPAGSECNWYAVYCDLDETTVVALALGSNHLEWALALLSLAAAALGSTALRRRQV